MPDSSSSVRIIENWFVFRKACVLTRKHESSEISSGPKPPQTEILFLHGRYGDISVCDALGELVSNQATLHCLELPGFGRSFSMDGGELALHELVELAAEVARDLVRAKPDAHWVLCGHDLGALVAELAALQLAQEGTFPVFDLILIDPLPLWAELSQEWLARRRLKRLLKRSPLLPKALRAQIKPPRHSVIARLAETWPGPMERLFWTRLKREYKGSVLVLYGSFDLLNPPAHAHEVLSHYKDADYFENDKCGHWLPLEDPSWVSEKMKSFIFRTRDRSRIGAKQAV